MSINTPPESWLQLEGIHILNPHFITHIKRLAKQLRKERANQLPLFQARDIVSRSYGFESWNHLQNTFTIESVRAEWSSSTYSPDSPHKKLNFCTDKQLHGAIYRYLNITPHTQVVQFVVDSSDYYKPALELHKSEEDSLSVLIKKGIVPDYSFQNWLTQNDPYFDPDIMGEIKAFRFLHSSPINHNEATAILEQIFIDIGFIECSYSCWPYFIWIDGLLYKDIIPPDLDLGDDSLPITKLPDLVSERIYK